MTIINRSANRKIKLLFFKSIIACGFCFAVIANVYAVEQSEVNPLLYRITGGEGKAYVLGSIHFGMPHMYPLPDLIYKSFRESDFLVVEANVFEGLIGSAIKMIWTGLYSGNEGIEQHISTDTMRMLLQYLKDRNLPYKTYRRYKPWYLAMTIQGMESIGAGLDVANGIEAHFIRRARGKKKILELESADFQIKLLDSLDAKEQEKMLKNALEWAGKSPDVKKEAREFVDMWLKGDTEGIEKLLLRDFGDGNVMHSVGKKLLNERNHGMAEKISEYLKKGDTYFVIIGAGHIIGDENVIDLLKEKGFKINRARFNK